MSAGLHEPGGDSVRALLLPGLRAAADEGGLALPRLPEADLRGVQQGPQAHQTAVSKSPSQ